MKPDIELNRVNVAYGKAAALQEVTLHLPFGKIYGLIGRNGAGKTTLLSLIGSFMEPTSGELAIGGRPVFENSEVMSRVTFVYAADYSEESDTVRGMLESSERYRPDFDRQYADYLVKRFELPLEKRMKDLSKGQQSAVNVTIGLANRSPVTIFDEAYLGMDAPNRERFYKELLEDHERHPRTVILSTHHVSEVDHLFDEVIILHRGRVLLHERVDRLLERGVSITGAAHAVDAVVAGGDGTVLHTEQLGGTKRSIVYGRLSAEQMQETQRLGLELGGVPLQQLFIHLTEEEHVHAG